MNPLNILTAREELKELRARYCRFVDSHDWTGFESLFTPDAVLDLTDDVGRKFQGAAEIVRFVSTGLEHMVSIHRGHMPELNILSACHATGIWAMEDQLFWNSMGEPPFKKMRGYGHYLDTYLCVEGTWLFQVVILKRIRVDVE